MNYVKLSKLLILAFFHISSPMPKDQYKSLEKAIYMCICVFVCAPQTSKC